MPNPLDALSVFFPQQQQRRRTSPISDFVGSGPNSDPAYAAAAQAENAAASVRPMQGPEQLPMPQATPQAQPVVPHEDIQEAPQTPMPTPGSPEYAALSMRQSTPANAMPITQVADRGPAGGPLSPMPGLVGMPGGLPGGQQAPAQSQSPLDALREQMQTIRQLTGGAPGSFNPGIAMPQAPGLLAGAPGYNHAMTAAHGSEMQGYNAAMGAQASTANAATQANSQLTNDLLSRLGTMGDQALRGGDLSLRTIGQMGLPGMPGSMGINAQNANTGQATEQRLRAELESKTGQSGRRAEFERFLLSQPGATPESVAGQMRRAVESGLFAGDAANIPPMPGQPAPAQPTNPNPLASPGLTPPAGAPAPGAAPRMAPNPYAVSATGTGATPFAQHESVLDEAAGVGVRGAGQPAAERRPIGSFLNQLDIAHPGFVRQNWPAIQAYIQNRYGESAYNQAAQRAADPRQRDPMRWVPGSSAITNIRQRIAGPNDEELGLSALGNLLREQQRNQTPLGR